VNVSYEIVPDQYRAKILDGKMRDGLLDSLKYLAQTFKEQKNKVFKELQKIIASMDAGDLYPPSTFGLYYEVVGEILVEDKIDNEDKIFTALGNETPINSKAIQIIGLNELNPPEHRMLYQRLMDTDPDTSFIIIAPPDALVISAKNKFHKALEKMDLILPELANEFKALIRQVIFVKGDDSLKYGFAGGSSYMLWGALFLNVEEHYEDLDLIEAMSHESGHTLLFGFSSEEPLVLNDDSDLYPSPIRDDLRPMDGIYHATYVCARICWTMAELLKSKQLLQEEIESVKSRLNNNIDNFCHGYKVIKQSGKLTFTGEAIMKKTYAFMLTIMNDSHISKTYP